MNDGKPKPVATALEEGHLMVELHGEKLSGGYALHRISGGADAKWLLVKMRDEHADARRRPISTQRRSVVSGRSVQEVAKEAAARRADPSRPEPSDRQHRGGKR